MAIVELGQAVERRIHTFSRWMGYSAGGVLILMMGVAVVDVTGRYVINRPFKGNVDLGELTLALICFLGWAYTQLEKGHVRVRVVTEHLPIRTQAIIDCITLFVAIVLCALLAYQLGSRAWEEAWTTVNALINNIINVSPASGILQIPHSPFIFIGAIGSLWLCLEFAVDFFHTLAKAAGR